MNMYHQKIISYVFLAILIMPAIAFGQNATEIIKKADEKMRGESSRAEVTMTVVRPTWQRRISMKIWSRGTRYSLILITAPARDEGMAYLKRGNEIWNWVPSVGRTIKLPPSMMMQSWMGSDFTNDDLVRESSIVTDYKHTLMGEETIDNRQCYKIEMIPNPDAPVVWERVVSWISRDEYFQLRTEFFDENGELVNTMIASEIKEFDGRTLPSHMEMIPADKEGHRTVMEYRSIEFNEDIPESFFTVQNMRRVK